MEDVACVSIPGDHVEGVTETVLGLYGAHAEAVGATALAFVDGEDELAELEHARAQLHALEGALADLGWPRRVDGAAAELVGPPLLLRELVRTALVDRANGVVAAVARYEAGREELPALRRAVEAVPAMYALFARLEAGEAAACGGAR
jgi:hypothetical protein